MITFNCPLCFEWKTEKERMPYPMENCKTCYDEFLDMLEEEV